MRMRAKGALGDWVKRRRVRKYEELIGKTRISCERGLERGDEKEEEKYLFVDLIVCGKRGIREGKLACF